tara:strand:+ start:46131 stop:46712 length:582 start_codon:yes stop_codon:yes gene_type:complete
LKIKEKFLEYSNKILGNEKLQSSFSEDFFSEINNKIIKINLTAIDIELFFQIKNNELSLLQQAENIDVEFTGTPLNFFMYILSNDSEAFSSKIFVTGDIDTANKIRRLLNKKEKFKKLLISFLGEKHADIAEDFFISFTDKFRYLSNNFINDVNDFLVHDADILANTNELKKFLDDVDDIKSRTEHLSKKYQL